MPTKKPAPKKAAAKKPAVKKATVKKPAATKAPAAKTRTREQVLTEAQAKALTKTTRAENKTVPTKQSFAAFVKTVPDERRRGDAKRLDAIIREVTGEKPVMWGDAIVGYGKVNQTYATGRVVDWMRVGFAPRKAAISLYLSCELDPLRDLLAKLGSHKASVGCVYIKRLDDVDEKVLRQLIKKAYALAPTDTKEVWQERRTTSAKKAAPAKKAPAAKKAAIAKKPASTSAAPADIDAYLATLDPTKRATLQSLRTTIRAVVPDATEVVSYGMPAFKLDGKVVAGFAAFTDHLSYLPFSGSTLGALSGDLAKYTYTKSSLHFPVDKPLPKALVKKLIAERRREAGV